MEERHAAADRLGELGPGLGGGHPLVAQHVLGGRHGLVERVQQRFVPGSIGPGHVAVEWVARGRGAEDEDAGCAPFLGQGATRQGVGEDSTRNARRQRCQAEASSAEQRPVEEAAS